MNEKITSAPAAVFKNEKPCDSVCIQTDQIYDSCREKDCLENLNVLFTKCDQEIINRAINVKARKAEIIWIYSDVEAVPFNDGFYTVDIKYFFRVVLDVFTGVCNPVTVEGLAMFDKKVILFGSEGNARIFTSKYQPNNCDHQMIQKNNLPKAVIEIEGYKMKGFYFVGSNASSLVLQNALETAPPRTYPMKAHSPSLAYPTYMDDSSFNPYAF